MRPRPNRRSAVRIVVAQDAAVAVRKHDQSVCAAIGEPGSVDVVPEDRDNRTGHGGGDNEITLSFVCDVPPGVSVGVSMSTCVKVPSATLASIGQTSTVGSAMFNPLA